jgi:hypothetical protein
MSFLPFLQILAGVSTVVGTVSSINAQRSASKAQQEQQTLNTRRSRRQTIREAQIRRAQATASAQGAGAMYGSGAAGGIGSLSSQLGETLGYQSQYGALSNVITAQAQKAQFWGDVANIGGVGYQWASRMRARETPTGGWRKSD